MGTDDRLETSRAARATTYGLGFSIIGPLPVFLSGALAINLQVSLAMTAGALGLAVALYNAAAAVTAPVVGRLVDHYGAPTGMTAAACLSCVGLAGIAMLATRPVHLAILLGVAGIGNATGHGAINRYLSLRAGRHMAKVFGLKHAGQPTAAILSGLAVPTIAVVFGWRTVYGIAAGFCLVLAIAALIEHFVEKRAEAPRRTAAPSDDRPTEAMEVSPRPVEIPRRVLMTVGVALGLAYAAASALGAFVVLSATDSGMDLTVAGGLLSAGGAAAVVTRIASGLLMDRRRDFDVLRIVEVMLILGAVGYSLLATMSVPLVLAGTLLAFGAGWGFPGLIFFWVVRAAPKTSGRSTGAVVSWGFAGGVVGPAGFGAIADTSGFGMAWLLCAVAAFAAAALLRWGRKLELQLET